MREIRNREKTRENMQLVANSYSGEHVTESKLKLQLENAISQVKASSSGKTWYQRKEHLISREYKIFALIRLQGPNYPVHKKLPLVNMASLFYHL